MSSPAVTAAAGAAKALALDKPVFKKRPVAASAHPDTKIRCTECEELSAPSDMLDEVCKECRETCDTCQTRKRGVDLPWDNKGEYKICAECKESANSDEFEKDLQADIDEAGDRVSAPYFDAYELLSDVQKAHPEFSLAQCSREVESSAAFKNEFTGALARACQRVYSESPGFSPIVLLADFLHCWPRANMDYVVRVHVRSYPRKRAEFEAAAKQLLAERAA